MVSCERGSKHKLSIVTEQLVGKVLKMYSSTDLVGGSNLFDFA